MIPLNKKATGEKHLPTIKLGLTSLIIASAASFVTILLFVGLYIAPEKTESIISFICSNIVTHCIFGGLMCAGIMLAPLSLLCLIDE